MGDRDRESKAESPDEQAFFKEAPGDPDPMGIGEKMAERVSRRRSIARIMVVLVLLLGLVFFYWLHQDFFYFFRSSTPRDLGLAEDLERAPLRHYDYVKIRGIARDMCIRAEVFSEKVRFLYFLGSDMGKRILIQAPAPGSGGCSGAIEREFAGRILDLSATANYDGILSYYRSHFPAAPASGFVYLLQDGTKPRTAWVYPAAFLVVLVLWLLNIRTLWRLRRQSGSAGSDGGTP
jgi:hypothetical protein